MNQILEAMTNNNIGISHDMTPKEKEELTQLKEKAKEKEEKSGEIQVQSTRPTVGNVHKETESIVNNKQHVNSFNRSKHHVSSRAFSKLRDESDFGSDDNNNIDISHDTTPKEKEELTQLKEKAKEKEEKYQGKFRFRVRGPPWAMYIKKLSP
ncbi:Hypothetical predicted protein [Mytilus galloprovincialis]|uniref:Uncharacterized protein n=1 Tax=Mytilus galloprovincialis TaxID=29158 RepID=A0A8B6F560_MYTGA|nr:Hypothetical predicted protein [Mytilus galloprovincialis]